MQMTMINTFIIMTMTRHQLHQEAEEEEEKTNKIRNRNHKKAGTVEERQW